MALFAVLLLVFGFLATGATRKNVYSGAKCIMGGRISAGFVSGVCSKLRCKVCVNKYICSLLGIT